MITPLQARPPIERLVRLTDFAESGCWLWCGTRVHGGYGHFWIGSRSDGTRRAVYAHRWSYAYFVGPIPKGLTLDHLCRVRCCVNPDHLEPVTQRENTLRGDTITTRNARKTHCPRGHPYDDANTYVSPKGLRMCRICRRSFHRKHPGVIPPGLRYEVD